MSRSNFEQKLTFTEFHAKSCPKTNPAAHKVTLKPDLLGKARLFGFSSSAQKVLSLPKKPPGNPTYYAKPEKPDFRAFQSPNFQAVTIVDADYRVG